MQMSKFSIHTKAQTMVLHKIQKTGISEIITWLDGRQVTMLSNDKTEFLNADGVAVVDTVPAAELRGRLVS